MESTDHHRLPTVVTPRGYDITLRPDITAAAFTGTVHIEANVNEPTHTITLNSIELAIRAASVTQGGTTVAAVPELDEELERLTLRLDDALADGPVEIDIEFDGVLNDKLRGFYRSTFTDDDGNEHTIATTQFEATNARRCFPCWDEPAHKAVFQVSLEVADHLLAVSAMSETGRTPLGDGLVRVDFAPTPLMSTYLLAFVVGELEASEPIDVRGVPLRIIHRPGTGNQIEFAHDAAAFCLDWLTDYFGVPYFGDKIDLLAIPDFAFGAMENTGCVTFREVLLLIDPEATTQPEQQRSVAVIAHELAHMWFGNLVTMAWWEGLWLKEAFATFMETSATDAYRPDWKVWEGFSVDRSAAFEVDCLHSTRAIEYEVLSPADAEGMYDVLTYEKGASVVRMLEQYVGPDAFREGIRTYMRDHAFSNTVTSDLWGAIESATDLPVDEIMHEWIYEGGFPLISARLTDGDVELEQRSFTLLDERSEATDWKIPVEVQTGSEHTTVLMVPHGRVALDDPDTTVIVDPHNNGFFRTHYGPTLAGRLNDELMDLSAGQRYRLFDDLFNLVLAGDAGVRDYVTLAQSVRGEDAPPVWTTLVSGFATLSHAAVDRPASERLGRIWSTVAAPELERLEHDGADAPFDPLTNEVRAQLFGSLGTLSRDETFIARARDLVASSGVDTSLRSAAVRVVASTGGRDEFDDMFDRYQSAKTPQAERRYLFALPRFDDADVIADVCQRALDGSVRSQDAAFVLMFGLENRWHAPQVWTFITENWGRILDHVPDNTVGRLLSGVQWLEHLDPAEVHAFLDAHPVPQARLSIAQHRERLDVHVGLRNRMSDELSGLSSDA